MARSGRQGAAAAALAVASVLGLLPAAARAAAAAPAPAATAAAGATTWVLTLQPGADAAAVAAEVGGTAIGPRDVAVDVTAAGAAALAGRPDVARVEPDAAAVASAVPADPCYLGAGCPVPGDQAALRRVGAESAWAVLTGAADVTVAIVDAGVDVTHPDLAGRVTAVPNGPGGCAALPAHLGPEDRTRSGHGTRVAGLIAAAADGQGIAGVAWGGVRVLAYTALGPDLRGSTADVAAAVHCAIDAGADVVNLSLTAGDTTALRNALDRAEAAGVVVVAAAGNGGDGAHPGPMPAAHPTVLAVTAAAGDRRAPFANGGPWVDLAAPGTGIVSTAPGGGWSVTDGTSYATPLVTGAAALLLARAPGLTPAEVRARLLATAEPLADPTAGRGLLDMGAAVRLALPGAPACTARAPGWLLDAYGGLHPFGGAPPVLSSAYWPGWDIARDVVGDGSGAGGWVLDGFGGLHPFGGAPRVPSPAYRIGVDHARAVDRRADGSLVVLDADGGLQVTGGAPLGPGRPSLAGRARDVAAHPQDPSRAWVLDAGGGVHLAGVGAAVPQAVVERWATGAVEARRLVVLPDGGRGYVLWSDGRLTRWAAPGVPLPAATGPAAFPYGSGRGLALGQANQFVLAAADGALVPARARSCRPAARWPAADIVRSVTAAG